MQRGLEYLGTVRLRESLRPKLVYGTPVPQGEGGYIRTNWGVYGPKYYPVIYFQKRGHFVAIEFKYLTVIY